MKKIFFAFLFCVCCSNSFAQGIAPAIQWQNTIGGSGEEVSFCVIQTLDGGYIIGGYSLSDSSADKTENCLGHYDYWILKLDALGSIQWQNTIGGSGKDELHSILQTTDGGYLLGGQSASNMSGDKTENSNGGYDYWIVKLDSLGIIQWQNTIGGSQDDQLWSMDKTYDGGYILGGYSASDSSGDKSEDNIGAEDYWVVKIDSSGNIQWQNTIGGNDQDILLSIKQTTDSGFILGGFSDSNISGNKTENSLGEMDYWVVKINSQGNIIWQNTIGGNLSDYLWALDIATDGGFILCGQTSSGLSGDKTEQNIGGDDFWVVKIDSSGNIQWQNTIGGNQSDDPYSVSQTFDGGYLIGGESWSNISGDKSENNFGNDDYWILKLNSIGNIEWQKTIGGDGEDGYDGYVTPIQTNDYGYIILGQSASNISGLKTENNIDSSYDFWVVKLSSFNNIIEQQTKSIIHISPNPSSGDFNIEINSSYEDDVQLVLRDVLSKTLLQKKIIIHKGENSIPVSVNNFPPGIFSVMIKGEKTFSTSQVILIEK